MCFYDKTKRLAWFILGNWTISEGYVLAAITSYWTSESVLLAGLMTTLVCLALTAYANCTKRDLDKKYAMSFVLVIAAVPLAITGMALKAQLWHMIWCLVGLLFWSLYLIIDMNRICEKEFFVNGTDFGYDHYILASLQIYVDILMIFIYFLQVLGSGED